jgi:aryl-alcohol dehydrogenase-like predicted oxidoreductase
MAAYVTGSARVSNTSPREGLVALGATGWWVHPLGFGCYRIEEDSPTHEASLRQYLTLGGNLIDTSANYTDGGAERTIGRVLKEMNRAEVVVVTKGGYIQGENMRLAQTREFPEVVKYGPGIWHCIHPEFLETQIARSRERMGLETIDVFLLHNPEYFLSYRAKHGPVTPEDHDEFYRRVRAAFAFLETQVEQGTIRAYGISSNNYPLAQADPVHTSIARCLAQAEAISPDHHFKVVQFPFNLFESGVALEKSNGGMTPLDFCRAKGIGTLANRPLNAFTGNRMYRLADFGAPGQPASRAAVDEKLLVLRAHEQAFKAQFAAPLLGQSGIADYLDRLIPQIASSFAWEQNAYRHVIVPIRTWLGETGNQISDEAAFDAWQDTFLAVVNPLLGEIARYAAAQQQPESDLIRKTLVEAGYEGEDQTLSQMAINTLRCAPGMDCVLAGMRRPEYVGDAMAVPSLPRVDGVEILRRFAS